MERTTDRSDARGFMAPVRTAPGPILVTTDGSPASAAPFAVARRLGERGGAPVEVVSVLEPLNVVVPPIDPPGAVTHHGASRVDERHARILELMRRTLGDAAPWPIELVLGERVPSLARVAEERRAQLVVTGHTHHGAVERVMRGETPLGIARITSAPVLAVPPDMERLPRCVVVGVGLGDAGTRIGAMSHALFGEAVAIHLVRVRTPALPRHDREVREEDHAQELDGEHAFEQVLASWRLPSDVPVATHERVGRPGDELLAVARSLDADLVVVGLSLRAEKPHLPRRSLAARLYREWRRAVLLVPVDDAGARRSHGGGTIVSTDEAAWPALFARLARRNERRAASLLVDDHVGGAQMVARSRPLAGLEYDSREHTVLVMLGDPAHPLQHLTHRVARPVAVAVQRDRTGRDGAIVVGYDRGQAMISLE